MASFMTSRIQDPKLAIVIIHGEIKVLAVMAWPSTLEELDRDF